MSFRVIEQPTGLGSVTNDAGLELGPCSYSLKVRAEMFDTGRGKLQPEQREISGSVVPQGWSNVSPTDALVLHLDDGRRLPFFFTHGNEIAARGSLK